MSDWNDKIIEEFRANEGRVGGSFEGVPLLLLHTTGARSGQERVHPMKYQQVDRGHGLRLEGRGADQPGLVPTNLLAAPRVRAAEIGAGTQDLVARVVEGEERERIRPAQNASYPGFAENEHKTTPPDPGDRGVAPREVGLPSAARLGGKPGGCQMAAGAVS